MTGIQASLTKLAEKGRIEAAQVDEAVLRIRTTAEPADGDLLIEAATENVELKLRIFAELERSHRRTRSSPPTPARSRSRGWPPPPAGRSG